MKLFIVGFLLSITTWSAFANSLQCIIDRGGERHSVFNERGEVRPANPADFIELDVSGINQTQFAKTMNKDLNISLAWDGYRQVVLLDIAKYEVGEEGEILHSWRVSESKFVPGSFHHYLPPSNLIGDAFLRIECELK